jgi:hypothetical protein
MGSGTRRREKDKKGGGHESGKPGRGRAAVGERERRGRGELREREERGGGPPPKFSIFSPFITGYHP